MRIIEIIQTENSGSVTEAWSKKYKRSINCKRPRGFSQRAHCQGKKKTNESDHLTEVQDDPYPFTIKNLGYKDYQAKITLPNGTTLNVEIFWQDTTDSWEVQYYLSDDQDLANGGDAFRIFATIIAVVKRFVSAKKPRSIGFVAYKINGDRDGASEIKLYNRLVQRYASTWGYNAKISPSNTYVKYNLQKKSGTDTDTTAKI